MKGKDKEMTQGHQLFSGRPQLIPLPFGELGLLNIIWSSVPQSEWYAIVLFVSSSPKESVADSHGIEMA